MVAQDALDESKICVVNGCCCCIAGLLCDASCWGCMGKSECLCCVQEVCCKANTSPLCCTTQEGECCQLGLGCCSIALKSPTTCCKGQDQVCCVVSMCAFPTDDEVPMTCAVYGLMCLPKCGCCVKLGDLKAGKPEGAPDAPDATVAIVTAAPTAVDSAEAIHRD
ncbi:hypothetical protein M885DRAFT_526794 [Pelagophyceae sp. CCMP2097]|nr:hypothetical protein M885DRAFT_526794 [Pelagophyceae sp. CCMP2097]